MSRKKSNLPFLLLELIGQFHLIFLCAGQHGFDLLEAALVLCYILWAKGRFSGITVPLTVSSLSPRLFSYLHVLHLEDAQLLLHLTDVAGGLGHLGSLQVPLGQQLLDVLLLLLQGFLERRGARYLTSVAWRRLRQLRREREDVKREESWWKDGKDVNERMWRDRKSKEIMREDRLDWIYKDWTQASYVPLRFNMISLFNVHGENSYFTVTSLLYHPDRTKTSRKLWSEPCSF